jgi:ferrous iron transport protein A
LNEKSKFFLASVNLEQFLANVDLSRQMRIGIKPYLVIILICLYTVQNILGLDAVRLSDLKVQQTAIISKVNRTLDGNISQNDLVASRLETLGFVPGTKVQVITKGIFGGDPILIQVGFTRFALRKVEAEKIEINLEGAPA